VIVKDYAQNNESGIAGQVFIRPIRPHSIAGVPNSQPFQATIEVLDHAGHTLTTLATNADGSFRLSLPPGTYLVRPQSPGSYPRAAEQSVVVNDGAFTTLQITYDSGIR
jgi:hypothetical protein